MFFFSENLRSLENIHNLRQGKRNIHLYIKYNLIFYTWEKDSGKTTWIIVTTPSYGVTGNF